jgi:hypothetical protein
MAAGVFPFMFIGGKDKATQPKQRTEAEKMSMQPIVEEGVYICTGGHARKYHRYRGCRGLNACEGSIEKTTKQKAERVGRKPCKICY